MHQVDQTKKRPPYFSVVASQTWHFWSSSGSLRTGSASATWSGNLHVDQFRTEFAISVNFLLPLSRRFIMQDKCANVECRISCWWVAEINYQANSFRTGSALFWRDRRIRRLWEWFHLLCTSSKRWTKWHLRSFRTLTPWDLKPWSII